MLPSLDGRIVTSDPLHNQRETARIISEKGGDSLQQVKENQPALYRLIAEKFSGIKSVWGPVEKGHGRIEQRAIAVLGTSAMETSFPYARSIIAVWSKRQVKNLTTESIRYYISSLKAGSRSDAQWHELIRGHWGGVENRNHWRKDAVWLEDRTRSRHPNLAGNLALLRNALLKIYTDHCEQYGSLPAFTEALRADPAAAFRLIARPLRF
jgi:predicted transposase YbfD/YdcC